MSLFSQGKPFVLIVTKICLAAFWVIFYQTHLVSLLSNLLTGTTIVKITPRVGLQKPVQSPAVLDYQTIFLNVFILHF
jgi:hypothetical protein